MRDDSACEKFDQNLAELALGILSGRERMTTLTHVECCAHCADELEHLARASDAALHMAPEIEPPLGFEVRLFRRMGHGEVVSRRHAPHRWLITCAAAVVALSAGLSIGLSTDSSSPNAKVARQAHPTQSKPELTARLMRNSGVVGVISLYGGSTPVLTMELSKSSVHGTVTCEIVTNNGVIHKLGTFRVTDGYGAWATPIGSSPSDVRVAHLVSPDGATIATAKLRAD
jgi:hypothetical protein